MKKARTKNIIRGIKGNLNRFFSILFIVALGSGFMAGLAAASPDMYETADSYIDEYNLFDIDVKSYIGFTDEDIEKITSNENIESYLTAKSMDMVLQQEGETDYTSHVFGILDNDGNTRINKLELLDGRMPTSENECVVETVFGKYTGESVEIGDSLILADSNTDYDSLKDNLSTTEFEVVGIVQSPMCIGVEGDSTNVGSGTINLNVYVSTDTFTMDYFTDVYLTVKAAKALDTFSDEYNELINPVVDEFKDLGKVQAPIRASELKEDYEEDIDELNDLTEKLEPTAETEDELRDYLPEGINNINAVSEILSKNGASQLSSLLDKTSDNLEKSYDENSDSTSELIKKMKDKISDAKESLDDLDDASWLVKTRDDLAAFDSYNSNVGKVSQLAKIFPVFFFIVALLVALTSMSRLVEEKRTQIGTLKALGYSNGQILFEYMLFSFSASLLGCILGLMIGFSLFPKAISSAYSMMYFLPETATPIRLEIVAWVAPVTIISILLATLWSCWSEFKSNAALLMVPKAPPKGKRIWLEHIKPLWKKLSFNYKVTARNLFRYKKRFIMTIIGVAGCSALLLTGFGIKDSVNDIVNKQFGEIDKYDLIFNMDKESSINDDALNSILNDDSKIKSYTTASLETGKIYSGSDNEEVTIFVPNEVDKISDYLTLRHRKDGSDVSYPDNGAVLTEKMCENLGIKAGDTVKIEDEDGHQGEIYVADIVENYVDSYAYITEETYNNVFGKNPSYTTILSKIADDSDYEETTTEVLLNSHIVYGRSVFSLKDTFSDSIQSINGVVWVLIVAAGLLSIVVLYNLTNVNICERRKELATLSVLGFTKRETENYIFRETNILSFIGAVVGIFIGILLHSVVVKTVEVNGIMFGRDISFLSFVLALAISIVFTLIVDLIMKKPISKIDMVEAMKAND